MVVKVQLGVTIDIFPNPGTTGALNIQLQNKRAGVYTVQWMNLLEQKVFQKQLSHSGGSSSQLLCLPRVIGKGY